MNWEAKGGKSNSQFRKTLDNRFILKEMSRQEVQSFLDFAPKYIQYMTSCIQNKVNHISFLTRLLSDVSGVAAKRYIVKESMNDLNFYVIPMLDYADSSDLFFTNLIKNYFSNFVIFVFIRVPPPPFHF
jgi:1-phosphatidylinositol-3-phosphate 5-kinase